MVGNGGRQWNSHSSVVLVGELVRQGRSRIRNKVVGECYFNHAQGNLRFEEKVEKLGGIGKSVPGH